jgi:hypothetical protein
VLVCDAENDVASPRQHLRGHLDMDKVIILSSLLRPAAVLHSTWYFTLQAVTSRS